MQKFALITIGLLALAGCSSPPASDSWTSSGSTFAPTGEVSAEYVAFNDPTPQQLKDQGQSCVADGLPEQGDQLYGDEKCTMPSSVVGVHLMALPAGDWKMAFTDSSGVNAASTMTPLTVAPGMTDSFDWNMTSDAEDYREKWDTITLFLGTAPIATSDMADGSTLAVLPFMSTVSYSLEYEGSDFTVTVTGLNSTLNYSGWLITMDDSGAVEHAEEFTGLSEGENMLTAAMDGDAYAGFHVHVAGTSINVATGGPSA